MTWHAQATTAADCTHQTQRRTTDMEAKAQQTWPPWPNGQGVGLLIRRLRVRVPQGVLRPVRESREMESAKIWEGLILVHDTERRLPKATGA